MARNDEDGRSARVGRGSYRQAAKKQCMVVMITVLVAEMEAFAAF
jgi:hypothetical protein